MRQVEDLGSRNPPHPAPNPSHESDVSSMERLVSERSGMIDRNRGVKNEMIRILYKPLQKNRRGQLHPDNQSGHRQIEETMQTPPHG